MGVVVTMPFIFFFVLFKTPKFIVHSTMNENQFVSVQSLDRLGRLGDMKDDSAEILFQSFLQEALVSSSGMGRDVHSLILSAQYFLGQPGRRPPSNVP